MSVRPVLLLSLALALALQGRTATTPPPVLLISLDGFGQTYLERHAAQVPTLLRLKREGFSTRGLIPAFPSNTFPNHYTLVTGLYPAHHGIVNNTFMDAVTGRIFVYNQRSAALDPRWWGGEPIWITAVRQGRASAVSFWVGSEAATAGTRPTYLQPFDAAVSFEKRLDDLVGWLSLPAEKRPAVIAFYSDEPNGAGHTYGPDAPELAAAVRLADQRVATILAQLERHGIECNVVVVSDHGMTATGREKLVILDDFVDPSTVQIDADGSVVALRPLQGSSAALVEKLGRVPHARVYLAEDLPPRFHLRDNPRIAPVWVLPEEGWQVARRSTVERLRVRYPERGFLRGDHGYDPRLPSMHGILIGHGPAFRRGVEIGAVENVEVYGLLCALIGLKPAPNDGSDRLAPAALLTRAPAGN